MLEQAFARVLTGPTEEARARLTASLAAGKAGEEAARVARNVAQSTFLHLMFTVGRVLVKFSVATTDGISPVEITTALARAAERRSFAWLATAPPGLPPASPNTPNTTPARAGAPSAFPAPLQPLQRRCQRRDCRASSGARGGKCARRRGRRLRGRGACAARRGGQSSA